MNRFKETVETELAEIREIIDAGENMYNESLVAADDMSAILLLEKAVDLVPDYGEAWLAMGDRYLALSLLDKADKCFWEAGRHLGGVEAFIKIAEVRARKEDYSSASRYYEIAVRWDPANLRALLGLAASYKSEEKFISSHRLYKSASELIEVMESGGDLREWRKSCRLDQCDCDDYYLEEDEDDE